MVRLINQKRHRARKDYRCSACECLLEYYRGRSSNDRTFTALEWLDVIRAEANGWRIKAGEVYLYQFLVDGSDSWSFKCIEAIHDICIKYELYPED